MVEAAAIEGYLSRSLQRTLVASGFEIIRNESCDTILENLKGFSIYVSKRYATEINKRIEAQDEDMSDQDLISWVVSDVSSLQGITFALFAAEISRTDVVKKDGTNGITCQQAARHLFLLSDLYQRAFESWKRFGEQKPRSRKFQKKRRSRNWTPRMISLDFRSKG